MTSSITSVSRAAVLSLIVAGLNSSTAAAQSPPSTPPVGTTTQTTQSDRAPKADVFAGVAFWNQDGATYTGFHLAGAFRPWRHFGFVGDVAFYGESNYCPSQYTSCLPFKPDPTLTGGVRAYFPIHRVTIFAQMLVGSAPHSDFALQPGVGLDIHLNRSVAIRVAGNMSVSGDDGSWFFGSRLSTGVVFALGRK